MLRYHASIAGFLVVCLSAPALGQQMEDLDSTAVGGAEDMLPYAEQDGPTGPEPFLLGDGLRDVNDSLRIIPAYDLYCHWNTASIFHAPDEDVVLADTLPIVLAHAACDHEMPVCGRITSRYGPRWGRMHYGVDIKLDTGDPVRSAFAGMVRISRYHRTFGHVVVLRHGNGLETLYAHLSKRTVEPGDVVEAGDVLGLGGSTGRSTGSHLHFEVRYLDQPLDPELLFDVEEGELIADTLRLHKGIFDALAADRAAIRAVRHHTVRSGDTLSGIARRHGTTVNKLCRLNGIRSTSIIRVGQRIRYR